MGSDLVEFIALIELVAPGKTALLDIFDIFNEVKVD
jgi:hypothetical protein